jgi:hypothetical protein
MNMSPNCLTGFISSSSSSLKEMTCSWWCWILSCCEVDDNPAETQIERKRVREKVIKLYCVLDYDDDHDHDPYVILVFVHLTSHLLTSDLISVQKLLFHLLTSSVHFAPN